MAGPLVRVGLVFDRSLPYCRGVLRGVKRYAEAKPHWVFMTVAPDRPGLKALRTLGPAGVLAHLFRRDLVAALSALRRPLVNVSSVFHDLSIPAVRMDDALIGRMAAGHLLDRGFRHFGLVGNPGHGYGRVREESFRQVVEAAGYAVRCYHERSTSPFNPRGRLWAFHRGVQRWLKSLPRPAAVFAVIPLWGEQLTEACRQIGLRVPEEVALVGVDNDDLSCELARPSLSSVVVPAEQIGYEAAALLDRLLGGAAPPTRPLLLPPVGVVARQSSDLLAIADPDVSAAVRFIRGHGHQTIRVADVVRAVPVGRRTLERRFRATLRRGLWEEIRRVRMEHARRLLAETDLPMTAVADGSGFPNAKELSTVFRQETGLTPTAYRRQYRGAK
jgi:LacI family transcriptional regulator